MDMNFLLKDVWYKISLQLMNFKTDVFHVCKFAIPNVSSSADIMWHINIIC